MTAIAKGATVRGTLAYLDALDDPEQRVVLRRVLADERIAMLTRIAATDELPYASLVELWRFVDAALAPLHPEWAEESGAFSINSLGVQLYGGILRKSTPRAFLTQSVSLFRLFYHPGDMEVVEDQPRRAVLRLVDFDPVTAVFCRRQTGGLRRAIEIAGAGAARVRHTRCTLEGDAFCEWELHWELESGS